MPFDLTAGIVRILLGPRKATAGTGFVLNKEGLVVTCAHVVEDANAGPGDTVSLIFYAAKEKGEQEATVLPEYWRASNAEDVAFLRLKEKIPQGVEPLPLGRYGGKHNFSTFGFPEEASRDGRRGAGFVLGPPHEMWGFARLQLRSEETTKGFSGAPVWDDELQTVIGMVIGIGKGRSIKWDRQEYYLPSDPYGRFQYEAFATPTDTLWNIYSDLRPADQCPYRNLEVFTKNDTLYFFGRERVLDELVKSLQHEPRFLAVLGPSGCGKSSLVQAGLLPRLEKEAVLDSNQWQIIITRPTDFAFKDTIASLPQKQQHIGLVIDQFEELFVAYPEEQCQEMVTLLKDLLEGSPHFHLILTLRNDFYSQFVRFEALEKWLKKGIVNVPATLQPEEVRDIIQKPADMVRLSFDEGLVEIMVKDVLEMHPSSGSKESGALNTVLPLLEFALTQLWERRDTDQSKLTLAAYRTIGGVTGGLKQWADEVYTALTERERELARRIFTQLVYVNDETLQIPYSCRRRLKDELIPTIPSEQGMVEQVLQQLISARLLVTNQIGESATIELSHEALIREWPKLRDLLDEARDDILFQQSLSKDVTEWEQRKGRRKQSRDLLYRGDKLKQAKVWAGRNTPNKQEAAFIQASATRQTLSLVSLIVVVLLLVSSLGVAGWFVGWNVLHPPTLVTTLKDNNGVGSLRWCIANAPSGSTITFAQNVRGIIELTGGELTFAGGKTLTIAGPGTNQLTISGGNTGDIIHVSKEAILNISGLSFKNSETNTNAFLFNEGTLTVTNSIISGNKTTASLTSTSFTSLGGGIENAGILTVKNSIISNNSSIAGSFGEGGGIYNKSTGTLTVTNSILSNNAASSTDSGGGGYGGGIVNEGGKLSVINSTISGNTASGLGEGVGGGIYNENGKVSVDTSTLSHNSASSSGSDGVALGGGISNAKGTLIVTASTFASNLASGVQGATGGGIDNEGKLTVTQSSFSHNSSSSSSSKSGGGGIGNFGTLTVATSTFSNNSASSSSSGSYGGGIGNFSAATLMVTDSAFTGNSVSSNQGGYGGGIYNASKLTVTQSTFSGNSVNGSGGFGYGGGILNSNKGTLMVTTTTFSGNSASGEKGGQGGGIDNEGKLTVTQSTFSSNKAISSGVTGFGGGIFNYSTGTLMVADSTFSSNSASGMQYGQGGGIDNDGELTVATSTFSNNKAISSSNNGLGGGIFSFAAKGASALISFSTMYGNTANTGGGIWVDPTGNSHITIGSSIIAANEAQTGPDISGAVISGGYNLIENTAGATGLNATTDKQVTLTELGISPTLGNNGGSTKTLALLQGSKAIDAVPLQACSIAITDISGHNVTITTDQRGDPRPDGSENACDIGAYESSY